MNLHKVAKWITYGLIALLFIVSVMLWLRMVPFVNQS